jgi:hypothetical protein
MYVRMYTYMNLLRMYVCICVCRQAGRYVHRKAGVDTVDTHTILVSNSLPYLLQLLDFRPHYFEPKQLYTYGLISSGLLR